MTLHSVFSVLKVKREERLTAIIILLLLTVLNALVIVHYYGKFTPLTRFYWPLFIHNFHISGFDPISYSVISDWSAGYNVYRHPLLAFFMYPFFLLNKGLMWLTGKNCAIFIMAALQTICGFYSSLFMRRIAVELIGLTQREATMLTLYLFSFGYVMVSCIVPDHFIFSMLILLLALYVSGRRMISGRPLKIWQTVLYFFLTAGTSLNNGLKVFLSALFVNRSRFFHWRFLLLAAIIPSAVIWALARWEYSTFVWPVEQQRHETNAKRAAEKKKKSDEKARQLALNDSMRIAIGDTAVFAEQAARKQKADEAQVRAKAKKAKQGTPISNGEFMRWTDISTSRWQSAVHNLFGEAIQIHDDYLLDDTFRARPVIVKYNHWWNYLIEAIVVLLFLGGLWCGRRNRWLWLVMSYFMLDMLLHVGLGFGLNEVYIMSAHYIYALPIATGFMLKSLREPWRKSIFALIAVLTACLFVWNVNFIGLFLI